MPMNDSVPPMPNVFRYPDSLGVRSDLVSAYDSAWAQIASIGEGWSAAERIAIAQEARLAWGCDLCETRKKALSPNSVQGEHVSETSLPTAALDAVHRIVTDASRITRAVLDRFNDSGLTDAQYVELLGVVVALISIDEFHLAMGLPLAELPAAGDDQPPPAYVPEGARNHGAFVASIAPRDLTAPEADLYGGASQMGNVFMAMSLAPSAVRLLSTLGFAQYLKPSDVANPAANGGRAINRMQMELIAARVSNYNDCFY